jgi:hypothetical protein
MTKGKGRGEADAKPLVADATVAEAAEADAAIEAAAQAAIEAAAEAGPDPAAMDEALDEGLTSADYSTAFSPRNVAVGLAIVAGLVAFAASRRRRRGRARREDG